MSVSSCPFDLRILQYVQLLDRGLDAAVFFDRESVNGLPFNQVISHTSLWSSSYEQLLYRPAVMLVSSVT